MKKKAINKNQPVLAITQGEPAGIGTEIILKSWLESTKKGSNLPAFFVIGDASFLNAQAKRFKLDVSIVESTPEDAAELFPSALPVLPLDNCFDVKPGKPHEKNAALVAQSIETAVDLCLDGDASAMVTAPINKKALYDAGFAFPGHTEFLAELAQQKTGEKFHPVMMLAGSELRAVPVTIHIPLSQVPKALTKELIVETTFITAHDLKSRFGIADPVIAISGLNPHAGEDGAMGNEEIETIIPAIKELRQTGLLVSDPLPADTMFHESARKKYDVAICMYHDQALIPAKTLGFDESVNATLGLPFIRTSPDHGTAFDIAGKGIADPRSFIAALKMAHEMAEHSLKGAT